MREEGGNGRVYALIVNLSTMTTRSNLKIFGCSDDLVKEEILGVKVL